MMNAKKVNVFICAAIKSTKTSLLKAGFDLKRQIFLFLLIFSDGLIIRITKLN